MDQPTNNNTAHAYTYMYRMRIANARASPRVIYTIDNIIMKGTKVQTLGARAVAGAWCMAGRLIAIGQL